MNNALKRMNQEVQVGLRAAENKFFAFEID